MAGAAAAMGISGMRYPLLFDLLDEDVGFPRLLELGCFLDFVWADDLLVVFVVSDDLVSDDRGSDDRVSDDRAVVAVVELDELDGFAVVEVVDFRVVDVVELFSVVEVVEDEELVDDDELDDDELDDDEAEEGDDDDDDEEDDVASVISMLRWPSLDSEFPSLTTKLNPSTSTPEGAW
jgi:hypothetical protein